MHSCLERLQPPSKRHEWLLTMFVFNRGRKSAKRFATQQLEPRMPTSFKNFKTLPPATHAFCMDRLVQHL
jgi:hypothetical protein